MKIYLFYDLEYKNGDRHIVGLIVSLHIPTVSKGFKVQIKKVKGKITICINTSI